MKIVNIRHVTYTFLGKHDNVDIWGAVDIMSDIGFSIHKLRIQKHMTQQQLARFLHITRTTLSNYERGKRLPDIYMVKKIADIFEVSIDSLLEG